MSVKDAGVPGMYLGDERLPLALQGADGGVISLADRASFKLQLTGHANARKGLIQDLNSETTGPAADLAAFVRKRQLQTYTSLKKLEEALRETAPNQPQEPRFVNGRFEQPGDGLNTLGGRLQLIARLIQKGLGTRIYYVQLGGFDTHSRQADEHANLLSNLSNSIGQFINSLGEHADRVALMTYSEFGRRVRENGSRGTDHGSGSCMFLAGNKVVGGLVGKHPSLADLTDGDLKYHTDFRRVYATLLDDWLGVDSRGVLHDKYEKLALIDKNKKAPTKTGSDPFQGNPVLTAPPKAEAVEPPPPAKK
jgi:uncharacterized protein (DUF1501 family)